MVRTHKGVGMLRKVRWQFLILGLIALTCSLSWAQPEKDPCPQSLIDRYLEEALDHWAGEHPMGVFVLGRGAKDSKLTVLVTNPTAKRFLEADFRESALMPESISGLNNDEQRALGISTLRLEPGEDVRGRFAESRLAEQTLAIDVVLLPPYMRMGPAPKSGRGKERGRETVELLLSDEPKVVEVCVHGAQFSLPYRGGERLVTWHTGDIGVYITPGADIDRMKSLLEGLPFSVSFNEVTQDKLSPSQRVLRHKAGPKFAHLLASNFITEFNHEYLVTVIFSDSKHPRLSWMALERDGLREVRMVKPNGEPWSDEEVIHQSTGKRFQGWGDAYTIRSIARIPGVSRIRFEDSREFPGPDEATMPTRPLEDSKFEVLPLLAAELLDAQDNFTIDAMLTFSKPFQIALRAMPGKGMLPVDETNSTFPFLTEDEIAKVKEEFRSRTQDLPSLQVVNNLSITGGVLILIRSSAKDLRLLLAREFPAARQATINRTYFAPPRKDDGPSE